MVWTFFLNIATDLLSTQRCAQKKRLVWPCEQSGYHICLLSFTPKALRTLECVYLSSTLQATQKTQPSSGVFASTCGAEEINKAPSTLRNVVAVDSNRVHMGPQNKQKNLSFQGLQVSLLPSEPPGSKMSLHSVSDLCKF